MSTRQSFVGILMLIGVVMPGCAQWYADQADQEVYRLIDQRQREVLGTTQLADLGPVDLPVHVDREAYEFAPHPVEIEEAPYELKEAGEREPALSLPPATAPAEAPPPATGPEMPGAGSGQADTPPAPAATDGTVPLRLRRNAQEAVDRQRAESAAMNSSARTPDPSEVFRPDPEDTELLDHIGGAVPDTQPAPTGLPSAPIKLGGTPLSLSGSPLAQGPPRTILTLSEALHQAFRNSREFQTAKEDLYLAGLALSLERFLWTPQFVGQIESRYANYGQIRDFDHAMEAVARFGAEQRLPYGGQVTANVISSLMRDLTNHVTTGESGAIILGADIPLLRGAGKVAYESRYQAERDLIYAVRAFERFRQVLSVNIASDYFNLQRLRQGIVNAHDSYLAFGEEVDRARALFRAGRLIPVEVQRAEQEQLGLYTNVIDSIEAYQTALDAFKIRLAMSPDAAIDVAYPEGIAEDIGDERELVGRIDRGLTDALIMPGVDEDAAVRIAWKYRLDLLNDLDRVDDSARGVNIAENNLLPDLTANGTVTMNTDPGHLNTAGYNTERTTWRGGVTLDLPLNRQAERTALRGAVIGKARAERDYEQARDTVRLQVRRAMRRVMQEQAALQIQLKNRDLALSRRRAARALFDRAKVGNRDVVEAENALLAARNRLVASQTRLQQAVLEFRRDTGTLRIDEDGKWTVSVAETEPTD